MLQKVQPGNTLRIPATDYNAFVDAALAHKQRQLDGNGSRTLADYQGSAVPIRNDSGSAVARFAVLGIDGILVTPSANLGEFQSNWGLVGATPSTASHVGKWAVCVEPIAAGKIGLAVVSGITVVQLAVDSPSFPHPLVDIQNSSTVAKSNWYGAGEIMAEETTGGQRWALIRLGNFQAPPYLGKAAAAIAAGGAGDCKIWTGGSERETVTGHLSWMEGTHAVASGDELALQFFRDENKWRIVNAEC